MKRAQCSGPGEPIIIADVPVPTPAAGQAIVKVGRCGICSSDLHATSSHGFMPPGYPLGHEVAGEVVEIGSGVTRLKVGDRVAPLAAQGGCGKCAACLSENPVWCTNQAALIPFLGYAEYVAVTEWSVLKLPAAFSLADGALIEPLACSLHGVNIAGVMPGMRALVIGAGPIGLGAIYWARRLGAGRIVATALTNQKAEFAHAMGADAFLSGAISAPEVTEALGGAPDVVFHCSGVPGGLTQSLELIRKRGVIVMLGACAKPETVVTTDGTMKEATIKFPLMYGLNDYQVVADSFERGWADPRLMVTGTVGLSELPGTFESLRSTRTHCKVLVDPWR